MATIVLSNRVLIGIDANWIIAQMNNGERSAEEVVKSLPQTTRKELLERTVPLDEVPDGEPMFNLDDNTLIELAR